MDASPRASSVSLRSDGTRSPENSRASFEALDAQVDRPARLQMAVALLLLVVLIAVPLYMWRRPRAEAIPVSSGGEAALPPVTSTASAAPPDEKVVLGDAKIISCHDPGPRKTAPEQCDHPTELEKSFAKAIEDSATCVPHDAGGGTLIYLADVAFKKRLVAVTTLKEGRTLKSPRVAGACEKVVKSRLSMLAFDAIKHEHARYRISITATYPGAIKP